VAQTSADAAGNPQEPGRLSKARWLLGRVGRHVERLLAIIGALFIAYHLTLHVSVISSGSMSPTLQGDGPDNGDWVLMETVSYRLRRPRRWEVVAFRDYEGRGLMKRAVGLPGESVSMKDGVVMIDGEAVKRPAGIESLKYYAFGNLMRGRKIPCGKGYYVLGDDSRDSNDSRFEGPVQPDRILGRAWLIVWPPDRIGFVNP